MDCCQSHLPTGRYVLCMLGAWVDRVTHKNTTAKVSRIGSHPSSFSNVEGEGFWQRQHWMRVQSIWVVRRFHAFLYSYETIGRGTHRNAIGNFSFFSFGAWGPPSRIHSVASSIRARSKGEEVSVRDPTRRIGLCLWVRGLRAQPSIAMSSYCIAPISPLLSNKDNRIQPIYGTQE